LAGPSTREASPRGNAAAGTSDNRSSIPDIAVLLLLGLALRFIIAYVLLPGSGFPSDLSSFQGWSSDLVSHTPLGFYDRPGFLDYPPVYLLFLWVLGLVFAPLGGLSDSVKLIPIFGDMALAYLVFTMAQDLGASRRRALIAATVVLFNPITWFNSAIWGQADVVGSVFMLLGLKALLKDRRELAAVFAVVAALTKIQLGILGVLVGFVILRRSLLPRDGQADPARILTSVGAGLAATALVCLPFTGLDFIGLAGRAGRPLLVTVAAGLVCAAGVFFWVRRWEFLPQANRTLMAAAAAGLAVVASIGMVFDSIVVHIANTFGEYPYLTLNAYNPWALVNSAGAAMDRNLSWIRDVTFHDKDTGIDQTGFYIGPFPHSIVMNLALLSVVLLGVAVAAWFGSRNSRGSADMPMLDDLADEAAHTPDGHDEPARGLPARPTRSLAMESRAVAGACVGIVAVIAFALGPQILSHLLGGVGFNARSMPAAIFGDGLLIALLVGVSLWAAWRDDRLSIVVALAILAIAFFVVPTRAHERYLFPFFAVGALLLAVSWRWTTTYVALALVNTANLLAVLVEYQGIPGVQGANGTAGPISGPLGDIGHFALTANWPDETLWVIALSGIVTGLALLWAMSQMRGRAVQVLAWEADRAGFEPEPKAIEWTRTPEWAPSAAGAASAYGLPAASGTIAAFSAPPPVPGVPGGQLPRPDGETHGDASDPQEAIVEGDEEYKLDEYEPISDDRPEFVPGFVMSAWRRLSGPSSRPDRSASLNTEPHGRLNKLDVWVVVALIAAVLCMRVYRLNEPAQMYFDEVYHARTATEFLQDWQYGIRHDIYEWTHPHLAKYAIAGGLVAFSDDRVTATSSLGVPVKDALVQPRIVPPTALDSNSDPRANPSARLGDRLFVATGTQVVAFDLQTRTREASWDVPGASTLSLAADTGDMYVGTATGQIWRIDVYQLDDVRLGAASKPTQAQPLKAGTSSPINIGFPIAHLYAGSPPLILAVSSGGDMVTTDGTGAVVVRGHLDGAADFVPLGTAAANVTYAPAASPMPAGTPSTAVEAAALANVLGLDPSEVESDMALAVDSPGPLPFGELTDAQTTAIQKLIDDGQLPGFTLNVSDPQVAVAYAAGVGELDLRTLIEGSTVATDQPATSIALGPEPTTDVFQGYVAAGDSLVLMQFNQTGTGTIVLNGDQPLKKMPGPVTRVVYDGSNKITQALGRTQDGSGWTVYAIETNGNAVFSDAKLPFEPVAIGADATPSIPQTDRQELLAFAPDGSMAAVDIGQFAFGWRIMGVLFGALMAACLYLLARLLFKRRTVGLLVALFSLVDGMAFAQSRIAMNDTYVAGLLLLAYVVFALLWLGDKTTRRSWIAFWAGMPLLGVILGLALASKWVALYAIASIGVLILIRSALGRLVTILAMVAGTGVLGWTAIAEMHTLPNTGNPARLVVLGTIAIAVVIGAAYWASLRARTTPDKVLFIGLGVAVAIPILALAMTNYPAADQNGSPNYTFFLIMLAATAIAAAANAYHPVAWSRQEFKFAVAASFLLGIGAIAFGLRHASALISDPLAGANRTSLVLVLVGLAAMVVPAAAFWLAGRFGFGPLAIPAAPDDPSFYAEPPAPPAQGWLRLGSGFGLPAAWMAACLLVLPLFVYILLYIPWAVPWQQQTPESGGLPVIMCWQTSPEGQCTSAWPAGHTGQTLYDLTFGSYGMYAYHNDLRATHAASSPWWAWPMDLKPVWFESIGYSGDTGSMIYDGGNPILWWLAITGMAFVVWQAFKRRSLGLGLIAIAFFWQWLSWARIDRASFEYHFYTALPFFLLGLAYFVAEIWHGPSRRTWLLARVGVAGLLLFPPFLWLAKLPLCSLARVDTSAYYQGLVCGPTTGDFRLEQRVFLIALVLVVALIALALILFRLERRSVDEIDQDRTWILQLLAPVVGAGALLLWLGQNASHDLLLEVQLPAQWVAIVLLVVMSIFAYVAITARDPRRLVLGFCAAAVVAFVLLYPNLSALPMPNSIVSAYNGFIPTWMYGFEFAVDLQPAAAVHVTSVGTLSAVIAALFVAVAIGYWAWVQRVLVGYRRHQRALAGSGSGDRAVDGHGATGDGGAAGPSEA
jgi:hypothetical protein